MSNGELHIHDDGSAIHKKLEALEQRISSLENELLALRTGSNNMTRAETSDDEFELSIKLPWESSEDGAIETKVGEYGLAWLGNIVLFLGIVFLTHFISSRGYPLVSATIGLAAVAGILIFARSISKSYHYLAFIFTIFGHILIFYTIVRLHYFTGQPVVSVRGVITVMLLILVGYQFFEAVRRRSEGFAVMSLLLCLSLAVLSDVTHLFLPLITASAALSVFLFYRFSWYRLLTLSVILTYIAFLMWLLGNPLMGHEFKAVNSHQYSYFYLALCGAVYSMVTLVRRNDLFPDSIILTTVLLNGIGFSVLLGLIVLGFFTSDYILIFTSIAVFCLAFSAILKFRSPWKYSPALYALYGFVGISIALYGIFNFPRAYLFLAVQSLLVVSIALWFRSKIIVVMNLFLFMTLWIGYIIQPVSLVLTNFSFPVVAFFSARIINWQQERLNIKTELIRNSYLFLLYFTMLYAMYETVPGQYVTLSWTLVAVAYLLLSIILKNVKYRYMMFGTLIATAIYLFTVDLARIDMIFRIIAFLSLAVISIGISIYYVKKLKKKKEPVS